MTDIYGGGGYGLGLYSALDPEPSFDDLTLYYISLLIIQYITKPRARSTIGVFVQEAVANKIENQTRDAFDLETAVGAQLDILAAYRGAQRTIFGLDLTRAYFAMPPYDDDDPESFFGFAEYGDSVTWYFFLYADADRPIYSLNDDELRRFTKYLAKTQSRDLTVKEVDDILFEFFDTKVKLTDNGNMTITYTHDVGDPDTLFTIVSGTDTLPQPAGVGVIVV